MTTAAHVDAAEPQAPRVRLDSLTSLRFFGALVVLMDHAGWMWSGNRWANSLFDLGYVGVSFFFVLSGFVLTWSLSGRRRRRRFYWLRFARIWPLHSVTSVYAGAFVGSSLVPAASGILAVATCTQAFIPKQDVYYGLNGVSWSLSCEAFFYLLFPFIAPHLLSRSRRFLRIVVAADLCYLLLTPTLAYGLDGTRGWVPAHAEWIFFVNPLYRLGEFVLGIVAAAAVRAGWRPRTPLSLPVVGALATTGAVAWMQVTLGLRVARPSFALLLLPWFVLIIAAAASRDVAQRRGLLRARALVFLGESSFALYMTHQLVQRTVDWRAVVPGPRSSTLLFAAYATTSIVVAGLTHVWIEQPAERWLRRRVDGSGTVARGTRGRELRRQPSVAVGRTVMTSSNTATHVLRDAP